MAINIPIVKIAPNNSVKNTENLCESKTNAHFNTPSFGATPKVYTVGKGLQNIIEWFGKRSTPFNRFLLGATAITIQPFIDLNNKDVDEKTRKVSWARAIAKAIAGTSTGVLIRLACIKSINSLTRTPEELNKNNKKATDWSSALIPDKVKNKKTGKIDISFTPEEYAKTARLIKKHRETIGSIVALGVMLITNFALDVPITKFLTNKIVDKYVSPVPENNKTKGGQ